MKTAKKTEQIKDFFKDCEIMGEIEGHTCSVSCQHCGDRIWFIGSLFDEDSPANFNCPYCDKITVNKYKVFGLYKEMEGR